MGFGRTWFVKKKSDLKDWELYNTSMFLIMEASNIIMKLLISY